MLELVVDVRVGCGWWMSELVMDVRAGGKWWMLELEVGGGCQSWW